MERMGLSWDQFNPLMRKTHYLGAAQILLGLQEDSIDLFRVSPHAVQLARELDARAREASIGPDAVVNIQSSLRRNRVVGWLVVIVGAATVLSVLVASILTTLDLLGWLHK